MWTFNAWHGENCTAPAYTTVSGPIDSCYPLPEGFGNPNQTVSVTCNDQWEDHLQRGEDDEKAQASIFAKKHKLF
jgi:hypothetical protein